MANAFAFMGNELVGDYVTRKLAGIGWTRVDDVAAADVAFTCCEGPSALEDAYFDDGGLVKNALPGTVLVDLSASTPTLVREISAVATVNDIEFVEAPLSASDLFGELGFACYAASEDPGTVEGVRGLLEAIAAPVEVTGGVGSAQLAKAADTVRMVALLVGAIEAQALVRSSREGVSDGDMDEGGFTGGYPVGLLLADVVAAMMTADDNDLILPQLEAAMHLLELLAVIGGADMSPRALSLLYREEAASAAHGLDWSRAEGLYEGEAQGLAHDGGFDEFYDDDLGFPGGFGGYSEN